MTTSDSLSIVMVERSETVSDLVDQCAAGNLSFSGTGSLCAKVSAMGFSTNGLYEAVIATRRAKAREVKNV